MRVLDFFKFKRAEKKQDSFDDLLNILAQGNDAEISSLIYRGEQLSESELLACVVPLVYHFRAPRPSLRSVRSDDGRILSYSEVPQAENGCLIERSRHGLGKFMLLIIRPSWQDDARCNYLPLIIRLNEGQVKIAGGSLSMPFKELAPHLEKNELMQIEDLQEFNFE